MLKMCLQLLLTMTLAMTAADVCATPTPTVTQIGWQKYTDTNAKGFWVYWKDKNSTTAYGNTQRVQIIDVTKVSAMIASLITTQQPSNMCFVMTAFDSSGSESAFSNEACGFTGINSVLNLLLQ